MNYIKLQKKIRALRNPQKAKIYQKFFKTGKGEYGEGDRFLGLTVPEQRKIAKKNYQLTLKDLQRLIISQYHEERLVSLFILIDKFEKADYNEQKKIFEFYLNNTRYINNWDLVDLSAPKIVGPFLAHKAKTQLMKLAKSQNLWERRISIVATFYYIKNKRCKTSLRIAKMLLNDKHDLIHKAVGWMLREVGKHCGIQVEEQFLQKYYHQMPRTMLRYSIERFPENKRLAYLRK